MDLKFVVGVEGAVDGGEREGMVDGKTKTPSTTLTRSEFAHEVISWY